MAEELICELNLALTPEQTLAERHIALSRQLAKRHPAVIQLNGVTRRLALAPHLTIYQVPIRLRDMPGLYDALARVAANARPLWLAATEYRYNAGEASFELRYEAAGELMQLQHDVLGVANPLRGDLLLDRDPAGRPLSELIEVRGTAGDNIRRTGFDAVGDPAHGGLFHPHVTINWFERGTPFDPNSVDRPPSSDFDGRFVALGVYLLGPYGTCPQRLAALDLAT
jgi:hypothetical protein